MVDMNYLKSPLGILRIVEIVVDVIAMIAAAATACGAQLGSKSWVLFVVITAWMISAILFVLFLLELHNRVKMVPWPLACLIYAAVEVVFHFIAGIVGIAKGVEFTKNVAALAALTPNINIRFCAYEGLTVSGVFCILLVIVYGIDAFFNFRVYKMKPPPPQTQQTQPGEERVPEFTP